MSKDPVVGVVVPDVARGIDKVREGNRLDGLSSGSFVRDHVAAIQRRQEADRLSDDEPVLECAEDSEAKERSRNARPISEQTRKVFAETMPAGLVDPFPDADPKTAAVEALSQAAINLRDAELARIAAQKAYGEALDAFNRVVAPVNPT